jgi:membrane protease YdiL (CAAX protease family)
LKKYLTSVIKALFATILYIIIIEIIGVWGFLSEKIGFENYFKFYMFIQGALQTLAIIIFIYLVRNRTFKGLIKKTNSKWYFIALALGISFVYLQSPLKWIYNLLFGTEYFINYDLDGLSSLWNINRISSILLIPIGEELFFRRYVQDRLQKKINFTSAIIVASILFALLHSPYMNLFFEDFHQDWHLAYLTFFGGLLSGLLYYKSKSIGPSIILHIFWNLIAHIL